MRRQQELRKKGKKGFTLVELIVVIVILGILLAIAVPALVGYIDKARQDSAASEAATARTAIQTIVSDAYGHSGTFTDGNGDTYELDITAPGSVVTDPEGDFVDAVNNLTGGSFANLKNVEVDGNKAVTKFTIDVPGAGETVTFEDGTYTVD